MFEWFGLALRLKPLTIASSEAIKIYSYENLRDSLTGNQVHNSNNKYPKYSSLGKYVQISKNKQTLVSNFRPRGLYQD